MVLGRGVLLVARIRGHARTRPTSPHPLRGVSINAFLSTHSAIGQDHRRSGRGRQWSHAISLLGVSAECDSQTHFDSHDEMI